jgi:hypothetical protein
MGDDADGAGDFFLLFHDLYSMYPRFFKDCMIAASSLSDKARSSC